MKRIFILSITLLLLLSLSIFSSLAIGAVISPDYQSAEISYSWYVEGNAAFNSYSPITDTTTTSMVIQENGWNTLNTDMNGRSVVSVPGVSFPDFDYAYSSGDTSGFVLSPEPGKLYDNLPVLFEQPDGSYLNQYIFDDSWAQAESSVDFTESLNANQNVYNVNLFSRADTYAYVPSGYFYEQANAIVNADIRLSIPFDVIREAGDSQTFDLGLDFSIFNAEDDGMYEWLENSWSITLINVSTSEDLLVVSDLDLSPDESVNIYTGIVGLDFNDSYQLEIYSESFSDADSTVIPILEPTEDPNVFIVTGENLISETNYSLTDIRTSWSASAVSVVPEPISSTLFIVGGVTLGFRRFRKKFKK